MDKLYGKKCKDEKEAEEFRRFLVRKYGSGRLVVRPLWKKSGMYLFRVF